MTIKSTLSALVGQLLDQMTAGRKPKKDEGFKRDAYRENNDEPRFSVLDL